MHSKEAPNITARRIYGQHAPFPETSSLTLSNPIEVARVVALPGNHTD